MSKLLVAIEDKIRDELVRINLDINTPVKKLLEELIEEFGLPRRDFDLSEIEYQLVRTADNQILADDASLSIIGVAAGELLQLVSHDGRRVWSTVQKLLDEIEEAIIDEVTGKIKDKIIEEVWDRVTKKLGKIEKTLVGGNRVERLKKWIDEIGGPTKLVEVVEEASKVKEISGSAAKGGLSGLAKAGLALVGAAGVAGLAVVSVAIIALVLIFSSKRETPSTPRPEASEAMPTEEPIEPPGEVPTDLPAVQPTEPPTVDSDFPGINCMGSSPGDEVTVYSQWSGDESELFYEILQPLVDECGIQVIAQARVDQEMLDASIEAGSPPDILIWPSTGPMLTYADLLTPVEDAGAHRENYRQFWINIGSTNPWLAVPVRADIKSLIWYSPKAFEVNGYGVPNTLKELDALVEQMVADGVVPWSMGFESGSATGWIGSDFIQDLLLTLEGPEYVLGIIDGSIPYNDAGVAEAYEIYAKWATDPAYTVGGARGTRAISFLDAIYMPFSLSADGSPSNVMMVRQGSFAGDVIADKFPDLIYGEDYDFFPFPGALGVQGGADWMMVFNPTPAAQAVIRYLTSEEGAQNWASASFELSPNSAAIGYYIDDQLAKKAAILDSAGGFTPDLGDSMPGGFTNAEWDAIIAVVSGELSIEEALASVAENFSP